MISIETQITIESLECIAIQAHQLTQGSIVNMALSERKQLLDASFEWTPENKKQMLRLNQTYIDRFGKLETEGFAVFELLKSRMNDDDVFLNEFTLETRIIPLVCVPDTEEGEWRKKEDGIERVLIDRIADEGTLRLNWHSYKSSRDYDEFNDQSWDIMPMMQGQFDGCRISYAIYELDSHNWSFYDILKINNLRTELRVTHKSIKEKCGVVQPLPGFWF